MRALLVVAALLLAAAPAVARPHHARKAKASCAAAAAHTARAAQRAHSRRARRGACARMRRGKLHPAARALGAFTFAPAPPTGDAPRPAGTPAPTPTPSATPDPGPTLPPVYSDPRAVQVQAIEFALLLSKTRVSAGDVRVEFNLSRAEDPHNLFLVRADGTGPTYSFDEEPSGAVVAKTLPLTSGKWTLFCALPEHASKGMRATLTVASG